MTDKERVEHMADCNWKPANQYWREQYVNRCAEIEQLKQRIKELEK